MHQIICRVLIVIFFAQPVFLYAACPDLLGQTNDKPDDIYEALDNGTVIDHETGLQWQRCSLGLSGDDCQSGAAKKYTVQAALAAANDNNMSGYDDWRLPNVKELFSLVDLSCAAPVINSTIFPNTQKHPTATDLSGMFYDEGEYWTSTQRESNVRQHYYVAFTLGAVNLRGKSSDFYVRLVRDKD